ncbi:mercuric reductase [Salinispira pacifica]|uniref:PF00070 family, FAD-dependent NAD(P)-disulfide oxidoreductase n=1 Tax=Salinispira pacifica TaxID=1307761 RepID=V5WIL6_9SPIO|nr:mercuric reductase [Salinispira pacifica]AHC15672.1 PF00070 family, FAD-dependent NAD(P)-disulfide oxidoreductase [Salinispira pacifica]
MKNYDVIIIGTGQATGTILPGLLEEGLSIATIESDRVGGSCVNWGCTPTKTLIASSRAAHMISRGEEFGISPGERTTNFSRVMERVNGIRMPATSGFQEWLEESTDFYPGEARFIDPHTVGVNGEQISGSEILIHTGTRARIPDIPGLKDVHWVDNKGILDLKTLPRHLLVLGGSYIGVEFAQAFRRLGSRVTIVQHGERLVPKEDPDISGELQSVLESEGIRILTGTEALSAAPAQDHGLELKVRSPSGQTEVLSADTLLIAVGRLPNSDSLNLKAAGVSSDDRGYISVDDSCRTSVPHIFALGDVNGRGAFTHTSVHDGQVYLSRRAGGDKRIGDRTLIYALYSDPPVARVGLNESMARARGISYRVAGMPMKNIARAKERDETSGKITILVDPGDNSILGATVFGVGGDEIISMLALAVQAKLPYSVLQNTVFPHPTVAELIPFMFDSLSEVISP